MNAYFIGRFSIDIVASLSERAKRSLNPAKSPDQTAYLALSMLQDRLEAKPIFVLNTRDSYRRQKSAQGRLLRRAKPAIRWQA